ncbi:MAG: hypothetical protein HRU25_13930, partial [Psychrobium sp.]|nr:hypothetical protein [Psychrobium sp.]
MNKIIATHDAQVLKVIGKVELYSANKTIELSAGDQIMAGESFSIFSGGEITILYADGTKHILTEFSGTDNSEMDDIDTIQAMIEAGDDVFDTEASALPDDIADIQALLESGDGDIDLPATAAGGTTGEASSSFISLERSCAETLADSGYETLNTNILNTPNVLQNAATVSIEEIIDGAITVNLADAITEGTATTSSVVATSVATNADGSDITYTL